jgi:hypothetical protein
MRSTLRTINLDGVVSKNKGAESSTYAGPNGNGTLQKNTQGEPRLEMRIEQELVAPKNGVSELSSYKSIAEVSSLAAERQGEARVLDLTFRDLDQMSAPWEMFSQQLINQIQGASTFKGLQLVPTPLSADWNDPTYGNWRAWRLLADTIPAWGPTYSPTGMQFTTSYYTFITSLDIPLPDLNDQALAEQARSDYMSAVDVVSRAMAQIGPDWKAFDDRQGSIPPGRRLSFDEWYRRFDGQKIAALNDKVALAAQKYTSWLVKAYKGYAFVADILPNYENPAFQLAATSPDGLVTFYRTSSITPDLGAWITESKALVAANAAPKLGFELTKGSERRHTETTVWGGSASWFGGFFGFGGGAGGSRTSVDVTTSNFRMEFSARNVDIFTITPGQWFNGNAVKALQHGPFIANSPVANGLIKLFSPDGIFNLEPVELVVAYRPRVVCTVQQSEFQEVKASFYAHGGFSIGPFGFGASYNSSMDDVSFDSASNTITAENSSDTPQIIAVVSKVLPNFE